MTDPVVRIFDELAEDYDGEVPFFQSFGQQVADALPPPAPGATLIDIGAGAGAIAVPAARLGCRVAAVDGAPAMVARLSTMVDARQALADALPFPDASFNVATAGFVLHIVLDPAAALAEIKRVLRPGGRLFLTIVGEWPPGLPRLDSADEVFEEFSRYVPKDGGMGTDLTPGPALAAAGFSDITGGHLHVDLPLQSPESLWRWYLTHGSR